MNLIKYTFAFCFFLVFNTLFLSQKLGTGNGKTNENEELQCITFIDEQKIKSQVGVDRKMISYIPGTFGRDLKNRPPLNCTTEIGKIIIFYIVDKSGRVIYARRYDGIDDDCTVSTIISWVKKYVKAEKANDLSYGKYSIDI
ncbi:hypothetical protein [Chryseobacterium chendengshani]|uniref:hypothetical protein n=1 Tax=unclassified Chryseobacterium TaxID=2593645 RepID=UPI001C64435F|nr:MULTISPECIES: hypothetical protein [unclassified Chryseobacterium]MBW7674363.1 hypothetical protein [Chryseobacterium sp. LJ756]MBW8522849.1 hypothetical protein [Chryseobacterium sp. LJ668]QYK16380.1 hypothetical protein K0U91_15165 [Chryseobacterium sp. LJ668]